MKFTIATVAYNSAATIAATVRSVLTQEFSGFDVEYLVVDGASSDNTVTVVQCEDPKGQCIIVSEPDRGIYDAMNKAIKLASVDVICFLNSDDRFCHSGVLAKMHAAFSRAEVRAAYGDIEIVDPNKQGALVRRWKSGAYSPGKTTWGWHPPHPSYFARKADLEQLGGFNLSYRIAADYDLILRHLALLEEAEVCYVPEVLVTMADGGVSSRSLRNIVRSNLECLDSWRRRGQSLVGLRSTVCKPLRKVSQLRKFSWVFRESEH